jgi:antitoxin component YwqK of YwqJK toxin-antitoxin module
MKKTLITRNEKGEEHGLFIAYHKNNEIHLKGYSDRNKMVGLWVIYKNTGEISYKEFFII